MRLHDLLDYRAREHGDAEFAVHGERRVTYAEAQRESARLAEELTEGGLSPGDRVAVVAKNCIEYVLLFFAAARAGLVCVPINYRLSAEEWRYLLDDSGAKAVFATEEMARRVDTVRARLGTVERFVRLDRGPAAEGWESASARSATRAASRTLPEVSSDDDLFQLYTSGTTGQPKGAVLTHRAVTTHVAQIGVAHEIRRGERVLVVAPVFHVAAANAGVFPCIYAGGSLYIQSDFAPLEVVRALSEADVGVAILVPAMIHACLVSVPDAPARRYERLRLLHYGASPIAEATLRRALATFRCEFSQGYGMTEMTAAITCLSAADHRRALAERPDLLLSAGRALLGTEVRVVDERDAPLPAGTVGEVIARGPQMMKGYWKQPEATAAALRGGWMHTGDAGFLDEEGFLHIRDRIKDVIISGGENVYPRMVEEVLFGHPAIAEAAVIGVPDDQWGEAVKAVVVLRPGAPATAVEIMDFVRDRLGHFERPRSVDFVASLPRTPSGKVLKRVLREPYWAGRERQVGGA